MNRRLISLTACGLAALSLAACATRTKPQPGPALAEAPATSAPETVTPPDVTSEATGDRGQTAFAAAAGSDLVFFAFDSHALEAEARDTLTRQAAWLAANGDVAAIVAGSADERGTREYNLALGARRAAAARAYLVAQGVDASRLETVSYGKEKPLDPASTEDAWARNRNAHTLVKPSR